jgi:uncharacterized protein involved in exopolysaccharide biosynthesis
MNNVSDNRSTNASHINPLELFSVLLKRKRRIMWIVGLTLVVTAGILLLMPNQYKSTASILPSGERDQLADFKSLARFADLSVADENSSELFPEILRSRTVKEAVLKAKYPIESGEKYETVLLSDYLGTDDPDLLVRGLDAITDIGMDRKTGIISLAVETENAALSQAILKEYLQQLEDFNLYKRRSRAVENERYLSRELTAREQELLQAEDKLELFQSVNRDWAQTTNPDLLTQLGRLQRVVEMKAKASLLLTQQYELAKLEVQKDVPIVRVLDKPSRPTRKSGPYRGGILFITAIISLLVAVSVTLILESFRRRRAGEDRPAFESLRHDFTTAFPRATRLAAIRFKRKAETV